MHTQRPQEIKARHLARKAAIYLRQSTAEQLLNNTGSTAAQRDQVRFPRSWGWQADLIETIDSDLAMSGAAPGHRPGYQRLVREVISDGIGAIFLTDVTRGGRDAAEWFRLLTLCQTHDTLIVLDGQVYDPNNSGELLMARLLATLAEHDNITRRETLQRGRLAKASKGQAVSGPPAGYVRAADGTWEKDPDPNVQAAIAAVFRAFLTERSCSRTLMALKRAGVKLPRRFRASLSWAEPRVTKLYKVLTHPAYAGIYRFRHTVSDLRAGRDGHGRLRTRRATADERIVVRDHHDPYVSVAQWEHVQAILKLNGPSKAQRNLGPGTALVQGVIRCALHRQRAMVTGYKKDRRDGGRSHAYNCLGDYHDGGPQCGWIPGIRVDAAVTEALLQRLAPPRLDAIRATLGNAAAGTRSEQYRRKLECDRLRRDITVLEEKFFSLDPSSVELAKGIEQRLETQKRELKHLEHVIADGPSHAVAFDDDAMGELITLCGDLRALWMAPETTSQDRKQIARTLLHQVVLEHRDEQRVHLRIEWADGGPATPISFTLPGYTNAIITQMRADGLVAQQIADRLNELGITTQSGNRWQRTVVVRKLHRLSAQPVGAASAQRNSARRR